MAKKIESKPELFVESIIFKSRWLLLPLYLGLIAALFLFAAKYVYYVYDLAMNFQSITKDGLIVMMLAFIDKLLVANLIIMVIISGYENTVSRIKTDWIKNEISWLGKLDAGSLKKKLAVSMVSISSVHLLTAFMNLEKIADRELYWTVGIHFTFVFSALILAFADKLELKK